MTSSLTISAMPSSRARRRVRTASSAVKQPAVFGRRVHFLRVRSDISDPLERSLEVDAAQRDGDDLGARCVDGALGLVDVLVLAGPDDEAALEGAAGEDERVVHGAASIAWAAAGSSGRHGAPASPSRPLRASRREVRGSQVDRLPAAMQPAPIAKDCGERRRREQGWRRASRRRSTRARGEAGESVRRGRGGDGCHRRGGD